MAITRKESSGIEITEARGDDDVFPSSSFLREYVSLERCELCQHAKLNATTGSPSSPMNLATRVTTKGQPQGSIHLPLWVLQRGGHRTFTTAWGTHPQLNWGLPSNNDRLGSNEPRVTSSQLFTSTNLRGEHKSMQLMQMARAQVLKSFTLKFQQGNKCLWGNRRGRTKEINK